MLIDEQEKRQRKFIERCRERGMRVTTQRLEVYHEIAEELDHPSADMVYEAVKKRLPAISLDTVYRTLDTLEEFGLIFRVDEICPRAHFDANMDPHHHFFCVVCGKVLDVPNLWDNQEKMLEKVSGYGRIESVNLQIRGICNNCQNSSERKRRSNYGKYQRN